MYGGAATQVRASVGLTGTFEVRVVLHQGSLLNLYLLNIVMDAITERVREQSPWTMLFADDIGVCGETREGLEGRLERWREELESRRLKISRSKIEYMCCSLQNQLNDIHFLDEIVKKTEKFKCLGSCVEEKEEL
ncbi:uncharacterized protein [Palaemon carinicauda]|uniref:uncharacterized protein n=1 Tax=Palaemon carinicauda TaxID=392227 RepID=UPI0035B60193